MTVPDEIFTIIHLNLAKAKELYYNKSKLSLIEKYLVILVLEDQKEILKIAKGDEILEKVAKDILSYSEKLEIVGNFLHEVDAETFADNLAYQKMQQGLQQGIEQGIERGAMEEKRKNAKAMLDENIDIPTISKITELSIKEIEELQK